MKVLNLIMVLNKDLIGVLKMRILKLKVLNLILVLNKDLKENFGRF